MIFVTAKREKDVYLLKVSGHADYAPKDDIVCAGVSAIVAALFGWLKNCPNEIKKVFSMTEEDKLCDGSGEAEIYIKATEVFCPAFMTAVIGLAQIAQAFPKNVTVDLQFTQI
ncbi:MAG: ribosomal-processing cysteine protease Prp [Clostridia bacterium]|nr:ribosomal-processing cysteine protease Prp [Clostridia bacterium]